MIDLFEVCRRALCGPLMKEEKFNLELFYPALTKIVKKYGIQYDKENPVNQNDDVADAVFQAAVDLLSEVGVYCSDTQKIIQFSREEVEEAVRQAPGPCWLGEGNERRLLKPRKPDDPSPPWCSVGSAVATSSEEIAFKVIEGYGRIAEANAVCVPALTQVRNVPIVSGSPIEIIGAIQTCMIARQALQQVGRPGLPILNLLSTASTDTGAIAASHPNFGLRPSDAWGIDFVPELKINFAALNKAVFLKSLGASIACAGMAVLGGYCGGPVGAAISQTAYTIASVLVLKGSYHWTSPLDINLSCSTPQKVLWYAGTSYQAASRNINFPIISVGIIAGGPMTKSYFYESTACLLTAISSGASAQTPLPAKGAKTDHQTPLEMQFSAEVINAASKIKRNEANEIVTRLLKMYEEGLPSASVGKPYQECFNVSTGIPKDEYLKFYKDMKREISEMGIPLIL